MKQYILTLETKKPLTPDTIELKFSKPKHFVFQAGQFVQIEIPDGPNTVLRSYSIASSPGDPSLLFCVKIYDGGKASDFFNTMKQGDEITISEALGKFTYVNSSQEAKVIFVATGTGIAPIHGILRDILCKKEKQQVELLFGVRYEQDIFWKKELDALAEEYKNFSYSIILSRPLQNWDGATGHVTDYLKNVDTHNHFYVCGSGSMVKDVRTLLINSGVNLHNIHFEIF